MAEYERWSDPTAARYYADDPPYLDVLSAPGTGDGATFYPDEYGSDFDLIGVLGALVSSAATPETSASSTASARPEAGPDARSAAPPASASPTSSPPASASPAPSASPAAAARPAAPSGPPRPSPPRGPGARPAPRPQLPSSPPIAPPGRRVRSESPPIYQSVPTYQSPPPYRSEPVQSQSLPTYESPPAYRSEPVRSEALPTYESPPAYRNEPVAPSRLPTFRGATTATPGTVPWNAPPGRGPQSAGRTGRRRRTSGLGCLPPLFIVAVVIFLSNGGVGFVRHQINEATFPSGATKVVDSYYDDLEIARPATTAQISAAWQLICSSRRAAWNLGQTKASSDSRRGILTHRVTGKHRTGANYTIDVAITTQSTGGLVNSETTTLTVVKVAGDFLICGGTNP